MCSPHLLIHGYFPACSHPSSVSVLTDTVLLHPGHLHDDSSIASGAYAKHKSTSGYGLTRYGSTSLQDDIFSSSAFVNWSGAHL